MRAYISGMAYRVGRRADIADLFGASSGSAPSLDFYLSRGLKNYCIQEETTGDLYRPVIESALEDAGVGAGDIGAVIFNTATSPWTSAEELHLFAALADAGMGDVPLIGIGLQSCSACPSALGIARQTLIDEEFNGHVLVLISGRVMPGESRMDAHAATIFSDGVAACIVSREPGAYELLAVRSHTNLKTARINPAGEKPGMSLVRSYNDLKLVATRLYADCGLSSRDIEVLFCTNGSFAYTALVAAAAGLPQERVYNDDIARFGHVHSCDNIISLVTYGEQIGHKQSAAYLLIGLSRYVFSGAILRRC
jgi:3-oxoacyl-[acyl-carrier-protein] synthase III